MILEYRVNEMELKAAWLKTLYELIEELDCTCKTHVDESYNRVFQSFGRTRVIEVSGDTSMLNWLQMRMDRYMHFISTQKISVTAQMHGETAYE
jgi:hypothetical protein